MWLIWNRESDYLSSIDHMEKKNQKQIRCEEGEEEEEKS